MMHHFIVIKTETISSNEHSPDELETPVTIAEPFRKRNREQKLREHKLKMEGKMHALLQKCFQILFYCYYMIDQIISIYTTLLFNILDIGFASGIVRVVLVVGFCTAFILYVCYSRKKVK